MWQPLMTALADRELIAVDLRGHGQSPTPEEPYTIAAMAADVLRTLDARGIETFDLLGLSIGGAVAQHIAATAPERLGRLILHCTALRFGTPDSWQERISLVTEQGVAPLGNGTLEKWFSPEFLADPADPVAPTRRLLENTPATGYIGCCHALAAFDGADLAPRITADTLVLAAAGDGSTPPPVVENLAAALTQASVQFHVLPKGSHMVAVEHTDSVAAAVAQHLNGGQ